MGAEVFTRAADAIAAEIGNGLVALSGDGTSCFAFDAIGATVWRSLERPRRFNDLRGALLAEHDVGREQCTRDLRELLSELAGNGLVVKTNNRGTLPQPDGSEPSKKSASVKYAAVRPIAFHGRKANTTAEFAFLLTCCQRNFAGGGGNESRDAVDAAAVDWERFLRLVRFHRVQALVWHSLAPGPLAMPPWVASSLEAEAQETAAANLRAGLRCKQLLQLFDERGADALFIKGLTLSRLAYGNAAIKSAVDIDMLVAAEQLEPTTELLRSQGYQLQVPISPNKLRKQHDLRKESCWVRPGEMLAIDLHTRLADNPRLLPALGTNSPRQQVEVFPGIVLPTLATDELFAYLTVHGASSAWFRLKWITDFSALLHGKSTDELEHLFQRSQELGAGRAAAQALLLADSLYASLDQAPMLKRRLEQDRGARWLAAIALHQLAGGAEPVEPTAQFLGTAAIHYSQLLLVPGLAFKFSEFLRQGRAALL